MDQGGDLIGLWSANGYQNAELLALEGDYFLGLAFDEDHQSELTDGRIKAWVAQLLDEFHITNGQPVAEHVIDG